MALSRQKEHYVIMTVIYDELSDFVLGKGENFRDARDLMISLSECPYEEISDYMKNVVSYSLNNYGKIRDICTPYLRGWKWDRLPLLTQSILLMSYAHMQVEKVDKRIVINVAVDLAKQYIEEKQAKFINAILDEVL
ncbi:MAG: hypothetical protein K6C32_02670 [Bacilli bacterium]|nr:hypothetical protein [Bacilli bacterium]